MPRFCDPQAKRCPKCARHCSESTSPIPEARKRKGAVFCNENDVQRGPPLHQTVARARFGIWELLEHRAGSPGPEPCASPVLSLQANLLYTYLTQEPHSVRHTVWETCSVFVPRSASVHGEDASPHADYPPSSEGARTGLGQLRLCPAL